MFLTLTPQQRGVRFDIARESVAQGFADA